MRIMVVLVLSLLMVEAAGAVQRLSDIRVGALCDKIPEIEKRLGSLESAVDDAKGVSTYTGTYDGQKATVVYHCEGGKLTEQTITVPAASPEAAHRFANEQKRGLIQRLGDPIHDGLELPVWRRLFFGFLGADLDYLTSVVVWGRAKEDVMLSVTETANNLWKVTISQGSPKTEYIFNS